MLYTTSVYIKVYIKVAYLENKFTQEVRKHEKKFTFFANNVYTVYKKMAKKFTLSTLVCKPV